MKKQPNKKLIGFFSLTGILIFIGIIFLFVGDKLFLRDDDMVVMYFEETIKGLYVGSPVVLRGVEVGKVVKIGLVVNIDEMSFKIPVYVLFYPNDTLIIDNNKGLFLEKVVEKGLRGRLATQNLLTGNLMIELEMLPNTEAIYRTDKIGEAKELPTVLSPIGALSKSLGDLPLKEMAVNFDTLIRNTNEKLPPILDNLEEFTGNLNKAFADIEGNKGDTLDNINKMIREISEAAKSLRNFADYIERHPESLLKGKGGY